MRETLHNENDILSRLEEALAGPKRDAILSAMANFPDNYRWSNIPNDLKKEIIKATDFAKLSEMYNFSKEFICKFYSYFDGKTVDNLTKTHQGNLKSYVSHGMGYATYSTPYNETIKSLSEYCGEQHMMIVNNQYSLHPILESKLKEAFQLQYFTETALEDMMPFVALNPEVFGILAKHAFISNNIGAQIISYALQQENFNVLKILHERDELNTPFTLFMNQQSTEKLKKITEAAIVHGAVWCIDYLQQSNYITQADIEFARNHIKNNTFNLLKEQMRKGPIEQSINEQSDKGKGSSGPIWYK